MLAGYVAPHVRENVEGAQTSEEALDLFSLHTQSGPVRRELGDTLKESRSLREGVSASFTACGQAAM
jgi:hypothetical protein